MKKAYYIVDIQSLFLEIENGLYYPVTAGNWDEIKEIEHRFQILQQADCLPIPYEQKLYPNNLIDNNDYIRLSVGTYPDYEKEWIFGFIFEAQQLVQQGAILNIEPLESHYDQIIYDVTEAIIATQAPYIPSQAEQEVRQEMVDILIAKGADAQTIEAVAHQDARPNELMAALEARDFEYPGCRQALEEIQSRIKSLHAKKRLSGHHALEFLSRIPDSTACEVLVREQLSQSHVIGTIQNGKECLISAETGAC